ncbi:MAG: DEAD/DEAH box helicase family protein [Thermodesulfobacteriota bacterium]|jgi:type III restriction enzyme
MMLQLKTYQEKVLDSLQCYFQACDRHKDADSAFYETTKTLWERGIPYRSITEPSELADIPYICLRLPTGGGKTLLACYAIAIANRDFLKIDHSIVLWLVPSNAIRSQTIKALRDRNHPYRQALDSTLNNVEVMDVEEALSLRQGVVVSSTVVIVSTLQAFRVEDKEGRKVYESAGALHHHFQNLLAEILEILDKDENGVINYSLANVMRIHRPLVIVDEAHNARTDLSFDTLARFRPAAIVEFTATPDTVKSPSNILHSVSAAELKAEYMIKLPIRLEVHSDWQALLADAIAQRAGLEKDAEIEKRRTGDYIRPIMLIQAQPRRQGHETLTVDVIEKSLIEDHRIPADQIARATGEDRGLEDVDLSARDCSIRFVITVQALREGWDCPFAYMLCSVAEQRSVGAVEQILGRILRLPNCRERTIEDLNRAYAFVTSRNFAEAANNLVDALVENGFNPLEATEFVKPVQLEMEGVAIPKAYSAPSPKTVDLIEVPSIERLSPEVQAKIEVDADKKTITIKDVLTHEEEKEVKDNLLMYNSRKVWADAVKEYREEFMGVVKSPSEKGVPFQVPFLCIRRGEQIELFDEDQLMEKGWEIESYDPRLTDAEMELITTEKGLFGEIDVGQEGKVRSRFIPELNRQLQIIEAVENWTESQLIYWLDYNLREFIELTPEEKEGFLTALVGDLVDQRQLALSQMVRKRFVLRKIAEEKLKGYRQKARAKAYQELLFQDVNDVVVTPEKVFSYGTEYPTRFICPASDTFSKHYYPKVGDLDDRGEEFLCAQFIDQIEEVEFWVRNLDRQPALSFWLQTSTDKFYPDFVCKLKDDRYLVVEYKGADRWSNDDSKEKRRLGELWALKSNGSCLFIMPKGKDWVSIRELIGKNDIKESGDTLPI